MLSLISRHHLEVLEIVSTVNVYPRGNRVRHLDVSGLREAPSVGMEQFLLINRLF